MTTQTPQDAPSGVGPNPEIRKIAVRQKVLLFCILIYIVCSLSLFLIPAVAGDGANEAAMLVSLAMLVNGVVGAVFVFLLATGVFGTAIGILLGLLALIPLVGLLVLLLVNGRATRMLRDNGISVGLLGAKHIPPEQ